MTWVRHHSVCHLYQVTRHWAASHAWNNNDARRRASFARHDCSHNLAYIVVYCSSVASAEQWVAWCRNGRQPRSSRRATSKRQKPALLHAGTPAATASSDSTIYSLLTEGSRLYIHVWAFRQFSEPASPTTGAQATPNKTRMWANAQPDGRPAEHRWRPLFNAAKFGWRPLLDALQ